MQTYNNRPLFPIVVDCFRLLERANEASNLGQLSASRQYARFERVYKVMSAEGRKQFSRQLEYMKSINCITKL